MMNTLHMPTPKKLKPHIPPSFAAVNRKQLWDNFTLLVKQSKKASKAHSFRGCVPMVKANAYGHGMVEVSQLLDQHPGAYALGVATFSEASTLREEAQVLKPIWVFSEAVFSEEMAHACQKQQLVPILHSADDVEKWLKKNSKLPFQIKLNTGLNRLGVDLEDWGRLDALLTRYKPQEFGVFTHFSDSDNPSAKVTKAQDRLFKSALEEVFLKHRPTSIHCANTGGILNSSKITSTPYCNVSRPGLGLYGYGGAAAERLGLHPALSWVAKVLKARTLNKGQCVGYGSTYCAKKAEGQLVLAVGYGDGFLRGLSNQKLVLGLPADPKQKFPSQVLGRVSMDLITIKTTPHFVPAWVTILGDTIEQGESLANKAHTIVYEILTRISGRVPRIYYDECLSMDAFTADRVD